MNVKFLPSPVNPADVNVIEGVYPSKPRAEKVSAEIGEVFVGGNEGLAEVVDVPNGENGLKKGDWVVMRGAQLGTWASQRNLALNNLTKIRKEGLSAVSGATMTVCTS